MFTYNRVATVVLALLFSPFIPTSCSDTDETNVYEYVTENFELSVASRSIVKYSTGIYGHVVSSDYRRSSIGTINCSSVCSVTVIEPQYRKQDEIVFSQVCEGKLNLPSFASDSRILTVCGSASKTIGPFMFNPI